MHSIVIMITTSLYFLGGYKYSLYTREYHVLTGNLEFYIGGDRVSDCSVAITIGTSGSNLTGKFESKNLYYNENGSTESQLVFT